MLLAPRRASRGPACDKERVQMAELEVRLARVGCEGPRAARVSRRATEGGDAEVKPTDVDLYDIIAGRLRRAVAVGNFVDDLRRRRRRRCGRSARAIRDRHGARDRDAEIAECYIPRCVEDRRVAMMGGTRKIEAVVGAERRYQRVVAGIAMAITRGKMAAY